MKNKYWIILEKGYRGEQYEETWYAYDFQDIVTHYKEKGLLDNLIKIELLDRNKEY